MRSSTCSLVLVARVLLLNGGSEQYFSKSKEAKCTGQQVLLHQTMVALQHWLTSVATPVHGYNGNMLNKHACDSYNPLASLHS